MADYRSLRVLWLIFTCLTEIHGLSCGGSGAMNMCSKNMKAISPQSNSYQLYMTAAQVAHVQSCTCKQYSSAPVQTLLTTSAGGACSSNFTVEGVSGQPTLATVGSCAASTSISDRINMKMTLVNSGGDVGDEYCLVVTVPSGTTLYILCDPPQETSSTVVDNCQSDSCNYHGDCTSNSDGSVTCACATGYTGSSCETNIDYCTSTTCGGHGTCSERVDTFECRCNNGYSGTQCETFIGFCGDEPCMNGKCVEKEYDYYCDCKPGYSDKNCSTSAFACDATPCQNGGTCGDTITGGYICRCKTGYSGTNCETGTTASCSATTCKNGGTCIDRLDGGYSCMCDGGYRGTTCDFEDTSCSPNPCSHGGTCVDKRTGGYACVCTNDYVGSTCQTYIPECQSYPCRNGGTCTDTVTGGFRCECPGGIVGTQCETDNRDCNSSPCNNGGTCENVLTGGYMCMCDLGFTGAQCENTFACASNPCQNSRCTDNPGGTYTCTCIENFTGTNCEYGVYFEQYGQSVLSVSSIYGNCYSSRQILGAPDVYPNYGDYSESWLGHEDSDTIVVGFQPMRVGAIYIYETYHGGAITQLSLRDVSTQQFVMVYTGVATDITTANIFFLDLIPVYLGLGIDRFLADAVAIVVDMSVSGSYVELDAIKVVGSHGYAEVIEQGDPL